MTPVEPELDRELLEAAAGIRGSSYSPYSQFASGAAVRGDDLAIVTGVLVENIVFGAAMCAERSALFAAVTAGLSPVGLAVVAPITGEALTWPCGTCRQVALELGGPDLAVFAASPDLERVGSSRLEPLTVGFPRPRRWR